MIAPLPRPRESGLFLWAVMMTLQSMSAQDNLPFRDPPPAILQLADADLPPAVSIDRQNRYLVSLQRPAFKSLRELAEPEVRLAGLRINPRTRNRSRTAYAVRLEIEEIATGRKIAVSGLPQSLRIEYPRYSPKSQYFSCVLVEPEGLALWVVELSTGSARRVTPRCLSAVLDYPYEWLPDDSALYCHVRPALESPVEESELPAGPAIQQTTGSKAAGRTYQDLLRSQADERRFDYFATTELQRFSLNGESTPVLGPGVYRRVTGSPDGQYLLVEAIQRPYSYQFPFSRFPYRVSITDGRGKVVAEPADKPLQEDISIAFDAVERGRREFQWRSDRPATIMWAEALDDGDPARDAPQRDQLFQLPAPFSAAPRAWCATRNRWQQVLWSDCGWAVVSDYRWKNRNSRLYVVAADAEHAEPRVIFDYSTEDLYHLPGTFVTVPNAAGRDELLVDREGTHLYLQGEGYSPEGNRPFLDEFEITTGQTRRLWRADGVATYEDVIRVVDIDQGILLTRAQSPTQFPNYFLRKLNAPTETRQITFFQNPFAALQGVQKQKIRYAREDGVLLSADLYLPAGYDAVRDGRLPVLMEAYPTEFKNKEAAGMIDSSPHQFVYPSWGSPVFWVLRGYAVLRDAQFPIVGEGDQEPNDTYVEQLVGSARAAIRAVEQMGIADPQRVAVMGHSYGAFMAVNLLAHCDLFAAGIARSGAYNRSLTPFGFQAEERTYWEAPQVYHAMSPFDHADRIKSPILLIHGEADNNPGTFTLQSERLFQAVKGLGGQARLVLLPYESHSYAARENILHMLWEMDTWLETHVKNRKL
jgi:dipeptidyl aminopeptidase/acylaminoacyl peptidase